MVAGYPLVGAKMTGFVAELADTTSAVSASGGTETVSTSISFTALAGVRYQVTYMGNCESTVGLDLITSFLRWKNSATADTSGTQIASRGITALTAGKGRCFMMTGTFNQQDAGTVTVVSTIQRYSGTGTVRQNAPSNSGRLYFLIEMAQS